MTLTKPPHRANKLCTHFASHFFTLFYVCFARTYASNPISPAKVYLNTDTQKQEIIKENRTKENLVFIGGLIILMEDRMLVLLSANLSKRLNEHFIGDQPSQILLFKKLLKNMVIPIFLYRYLNIVIKLIYFN